MNIPVFAQDLEPRRWTQLPVGMTVVGAGYGHTYGDLLFDPLMEVESAEVKVDALAVSYVRSFALAGKVARFDAVVPWKSAHWEGLLRGEPASVKREGFADPRFRLSLTLLNSSENKSAETSHTKVSQATNTVVGAAIAVRVPLGEYYEDKLLNLGENRFMIRPQIGIVHTRGPWSYELTGSIFFFTDNDDFFNGNSREQDPIYALQAHVIHTFKPGYWASLSAGYGLGGRSSVNGELKDDEWGNVMSALSAGFPVAKNQSVKVVYLYAKTQKFTGSITDTLGFAWSIRF